MILPTSLFAAKRYGDQYGTHMLYENEKPVRREGYMTDMITDAAVKFLRAYDKSKPLFLYLPYTCPHTPIQHPDRKPPRPRTKENWNEGTREVYAAMVERMDQGIGRVLSTLDDLKLADDALVIFASDNGGTKLARNAPFSGYKGGLMEGGIREPCMIRWPGRVPKKIVSDQPAIMLDFTVSILRVAGSGSPEDLSSDGIDVLKLIEDGTPPKPRTLYWRQRRGECTMRAVRDGELKYHTRRDGEQFDEHLFDLATDPGEKHNLLDARPEDANRLKKLLRDWEADVRVSR